MSKKEQEEHFPPGIGITSSSGANTRISFQTETKLETDSELESEEQDNFYHHHYHQSQHTDDADEFDDDDDHSYQSEYGMSDSFDSDASYEEYDSEAESGAEQEPKAANSDDEQEQILNELKYSSTIFESSFFSVGSDEIIERIGSERKLEIFNFFVKNSETLEEAAYKPIIYTLLGYLQYQRDGYNCMTNIDLDDLFDLVEPQIRETFNFFKSISFSRKVLAQKFLQFLHKQSEEGGDFLSMLDSYKKELNKYGELFDNEKIEIIETGKTRTENENKIYESISDTDSDPDDGDKVDDGHDFLTKRLLPPYFRSADGLLSARIPFDDLAQFPYKPYKCWTHDQLREFQNIIVDAYVGRKLYFINTRFDLLGMDLENSPNGKISTILSKSPFEIRREVDLNNILEWKFEQEMLVLQDDIVPRKIQNWDINWLEVSASMHKRGVRVLTPEECLSFWLQIKSLFGKLKRKWSKSEINDLLNITDPGREKEIVFDGIDAVKACTCDLTIRLTCDINHHSRNWTRVAYTLGNELSPFECLLAYREVIVSNHNARVLQAKLRENLADTIPRLDGLPDWASIRKELRSISGGLTKCKKEELNTYYIKCLDPTVLHNTYRYYLAEDSLLLAYTIELGPRIEYENNFNSLKPYLPWRTLEVWVARLRSFFKEITPWTSQQDMYILKCVHAYGIGHWSAISRSMDGKKSKSTIRNRFRRLTENLKFEADPAQKCGYFNRYFVPEKNWMTRFSKIRYFLKEIYALRESGELNEVEFRGFPQHRPPTEKEIKLYLVTREPSLLKRAVDHLTTMLSMAQYDGTTNVGQYGVNLDFSRFIDRSQFVRTDPASLASALYLRRIDVKTIEELENPTDFEKEVILHHLKFTLTRRGRATNSMYKNKSKNNQKLPKETYLRGLPEIKRILLASPMPKTVTRSKGRMTKYGYYSRKTKVVGKETEEENTTRTDKETAADEPSTSKSSGEIPDESEVKSDPDSPILRKPNPTFEKILSGKGRRSYKICKIRREAAKIRWDLTKEKRKLLTGEPLRGVEVNSNLDEHDDNDDEASTSKRIKSDDTLQEPC